MDLLDIDAPFDEMLHVIIHTGHSRFPVLRGAARQRHRHPDGQGPAEAAALARPATCARCCARRSSCPSRRRLNELLRDFRTNRNHLAIVIDEFGHTAGLITHRGRARRDRRRDRGRVRRRRTASPASTRSPTAASASPATPTIAAVNEAFDVALPTDEFDTIGGLVAHELGRVPRRGESVTVGGLVFSVMLARGGAVRWFKVTRAAEDALGSDGA